MFTLQALCKPHLNSFQLFHVVASLLFCCFLLEHYYVSLLNVVCLKGEIHLMKRKYKNAVYIM